MRKPYQNMAAANASAKSETAVADRHQEKCENGSASKYYLKTFV